MSDTFQGYPIKDRVEIAKPGSERYRELTRAIMQWNSAATGTGQNMAQCHNVARELTIERDHGLVVWINPRTSPKYTA